MPILVFDLEGSLGDIGPPMAWKLLSPRSLVSSAAALRDDRNALTATIAPAEIDRREEFRMFHPGIEGVSSVGGEILLNLSRSGLSIGVRRKCAFARGERYVVTLREGSTLTEIEGRVCWTRSIWHREANGNQRNEYFQTAGLTIGDALSADQEKSWKTLRERIQDGVSSLEMKISQL